MNIIKGWGKSSNLEKNSGGQNLYIKHGKIVTRQTGDNILGHTSNWPPLGSANGLEQINIFYTNRDQLLNKFDELLIIVENDKPD